MSPNAAASVRARLLNQAKAAGEEFELALTRFVAERVLYRLGSSPARERCILKGASLLAVWLDAPHRATRDIDLSVRGTADDDAIEALVREICAVPCPEDGLELDLTALRIEPIRATAEEAGQRVRFGALLGNARIKVQLDVGVGDALALEPEEVVYPTRLSDLPAPRLRAYPRDAIVAEKFEAMVKLDTRNSRMKDFHDLWALAGHFHFDGNVLRRAVVACFEGRGTAWTDEVPAPLTSQFYERPEIEARWRGYLRVGTIIASPPMAFAIIGERIVRFMGPVRQSVLADEEFDSSWPPGGPWQPSPNAPGLGNGDV